MLQPLLTKLAAYRKRSGFLEQEHKQRGLYGGSLGGGMQTKTVFNQAGHLEENTSLPKQLPFGYQGSQSVHNEVDHIAPYLIDEKYFQNQLFQDDRKLHGWSFIPVMSLRSFGQQGNVKELQELLGSAPSKTIQHRMVDYAYQREFRKETPLYQPVAWYVPGHSVSLDDIPWPLGCWDLDGCHDGDRGMCLPMEWSNSGIKNIEPLLKLAAEERRKAAGVVLLGEDEEKEFYDDEVASLIPPKSFHEFIYKLNHLLGGCGKCVTLCVYDTARYVPMSESQILCLSLNKA
eukprot:Blabericola_migrator_1__3704@NODE_2107_length_3266_cov_40_337606_g1335_i0_p3_GENE_NODE_2107_length_3266_cov_40_337606_g1335_i0NODE_2107_length_3266_cov_40_337606_g1335_i0_p3_ORF_typecomplete_len289_score38_39_NODE_2107_length_3266_cov_40_337606_g1335_i023653231